MKHEPPILGTFDASPVASRQDLYDTVDIVMSSGRSHPVAFVTALQLSAGYSAAQARTMFQDGLQRIQ